MTARATVLAAVAVATALALTGCGAPSAPAPASTGNNGAATSGPADPGTGTDGGDTGTGELAVPDTFPKDDVPLIEGDVVYAQDLGTGWVVYIARDDFLGGYEDAKDLLVGAGFTGDTIGQDDTGAFGQFTTDKYTVNLQGAPAEKTGFGNAVGYTVVKNG